jgi:hypothetical protein
VKRYRFLWIVGIRSIVGYASEILQRFCPGRDPAFGDICIKALATVLGATLGGGFVRSRDQAKFSLARNKSLLKGKNRSTSICRLLVERDLRLRIPLRSLSRCKKEASERDKLGFRARRVRQKVGGDAATARNCGHHFRNVLSSSSFKNLVRVWSRR